MAKTVLDSKKTEWKGLDRIASIVHELGCIWRETTKDDVGLDGEIEIIVPKSDGKGSESTGHTVKVQAKAGKRYVVQDSETSFASPVEENDLLYWQKCNYPVLYIVYHPNDDTLYFREVKQYIRETDDVFCRPYRICFDKTRHVFGRQSKESVCRVAAVSPTRVSFDCQERLWRNELRAES